VSLFEWDSLALLLTLYLSDVVCEQAYSMAQNLDPNSDGRGVLQFKTGLMSVIKVFFIILVGLRCLTMLYLCVGLILMHIAVGIYPYSTFGV